MAKGDRKELFVVRDGEGEGGKSWWTKIGAAFENRDGSYTLIFDALPVNGRVQMREPYDDSRDNGGDRGRDDSRDNRGGDGRVDDDVQGERRPARDDKNKNKNAPRGSRR